MGNIGKLDNNKTADLLRDEEETRQNTEVDKDIAHIADITKNTVKKEFEIADNVLKNASETVVEKGVPATSIQVTVEPFTVENQVNQLKEVGKIVVDTVKRNTKKAPTKSIPSSVLIEKLEGQIAAIKQIEGLNTTMEIVQLPKEYKEALIALGKEIENIKTKYISIIMK